MRDLRLDRDIEVMSGAAEERSERELREERVRIIGRRNSEHQARKLKRQMFAEMGSTQAAAAGLLPTIQALTAHERRNFSIARLVSAIAQPKREHCLELEISESISGDLKTSPKHVGGAWLPLRISAAGLDTKTTSGGGYTVATNVRDIIDALRQHTAVLRLGATLMTGVANVALPVEDSIAAAQWTAENPGADAPQSDPTFQSRWMTPHDSCATTSVSRQLLSQSSADISRWIINRIAKAHALLLDRACIHGSGTSNQPLGVLNTIGVGSVPIGTNGGTLTAAHLVSLESTVGSANGDSGALAFLTNTIQRAKLRAIPELAGGSTPLWDEESLLDYPATASNQVRSDLTKGSANNCSAVIFGDWSALAVCEFFGAMEIVADQVTLKKQAMVELSSYASYDIGVTTTGSFAFVADAI